MTSLSRKLKQVTNW